MIYWEQSGVNYPYQSNSGVPYKVQRGLIALGLFKDEDDIKSSPKQTFMDNYRPGDIKYKDVNGDGKIDKDDVVPLNYSAVPFIQYGFDLIGTTRHSVLVFCLKEFLKYNIFKVVGDSILS